MKTYNFQKPYGLWVFLISCVLSFNLTAQTAPDFEVTDSEGNVHELYANYLNQGKTVLIKIFFTTCPPCIQLAPSMEPFYQEWGAGDHDVEFFELSDKSFDTNSKINSYKTVYGMTFPGVGSEGGSLEAVAPYKNDQFGNFTGTPTFIVVAPDGSLQFDVFGPGIQGQFDALDQALLATGAEKPSQMVEPTTINGLVEVNQAETPLANVIVEVFESFEENSPILFSDTTDANGSIDFTFFEDSVSTTAVIRARKSGIAGNGLTGIDLVRIQRHLLNIDPFTEGYQYLISDANSTNTISALDLVEFQKIILGIKNEFSDQKNWFLIPAHIEVPLNGNQVPTGFEEHILLTDIISGETVLSFKGYKRGDLNGSADPGN